MANFCQMSPGILSSSERFAVDDLVVRERQDEILGEGVEQQNVSWFWSYLRWIGSVWKYLQRVVHPAHVPFQAEAEAAEVGGAGDAGQEVDSSAIVRMPG